MLKRIKKTLTCSDSSGGTRLKLKSHHLLHSDKSAYFYKSNGKVKNILYSPSIPLLGSIAFLLVLCLTILTVGIPNSGEAYAETINYPAGDKNDAASISFTLNGKDIDGSEVSTNVIQDEVSYISSDLQVTTNNIGKFAVVVQSASNTGNLVNSDNGAVIEPISSATTPANFANNTWGYTVSDNIAAANSALTYSPLLAFRENPTAQYTKNKPTDGSYNLKLVFAAKIGSNKPAGHYKTTALVSVVAEANTITTYSINYNANGGTGAANPATQSAESSDVVYTFNAAARGTLAKANYTFIGWSESSTAASPQYSAGSAVTLDSSTPSKTLYAVWRPTFDGITNMQQMTTKICSSAIEGESKKLVDSRDASKSYTVTRLKDGVGCWMTEDMEYSGGDITLVTGDSYPRYSYENAKKVCDFTGWQLPTSGQYTTLLNAYNASGSAGFAILTKAPLNFRVNGYSDGSTYGFYWDSDGSGLYFNIRTAYVGNGPSGINTTGTPVRCIAK